MDEIVRRWRRAAERVDTEQVRVIAVGGEYWATSSSRLLGSYRLRPTDHGWTCDCVANREYMLPCKHLAALAAALNLDVLADMRIELPSEEQIHSAAA